MEEVARQDRPDAAAAAARPAELRLRLASGAEVGALDSAPERPGEPSPAGPLPLVLVPGVAGAKELFAGLLPCLARSRRVVAVDLSPLFPGGAGTLSAAARDLRETLDALGLARVDLLGQSFGAVAAVRAWRAEPERIRRLVLAAPAIAPAGARAAGTFLKWMVIGSAVRLWPRTRTRSLATFVRATGGYPIEPAIAGPGFDALVERVKSLRAGPLVRRLIALIGHSWEGELAGVTVPLLVIEGDLEASLLPPRARELFRSRPGTRWEVVPGGHSPFLTRPEEFARAVLEFLDAESGAP
jgi:pimeloyl-ACP methyl ester carboxylesterase